MILKVNDTVVLREIELSHALPIFKIIDSQRSYLGKWLPFVDETKSVADVEAFISAVISAPKAYFEHVFTIWKTDVLVGLVSFKNTDLRDKKTEIGYWLSKDHQGEGIMTQSVKTLCHFAFNEQLLNRIEIKCALENHSSIAIAKKLGFCFEGVQRQGEFISEGLYRDLNVYSLLRSEY